MSTPLFDTLDNIKSRQRLTGLDAGHPALVSLNTAIDHARGEFYARLGLTNLAALEAITPADPPTTDDEYKALLAQMTEERLIRRSLLTELTVLSKEGTGGRVFQEWNDTGAFRSMRSEQITAEIKRLDIEIDRAFEFLRGTLTPGDAPRVKAASLGSKLDKQYRKVGYSIYAVPPYLFNFCLDTDTLVDDENEDE